VRQNVCTGLCGLRRRGVGQRVHGDPEASLVRAGDERAHPRRVEHRTVLDRKLDQRRPGRGQTVDRLCGLVGARHLEAVAALAPALGRVAAARGDHRTGGEHLDRRVGGREE
jgi:hypothetical protein